MSDSSFLDRLAALDTNAVSDALDFLQVKGATYGLRPLWDCPKIVGRASTVKVSRKTDKASTAHPFTPVIDAITTKDRILVISSGLEGVSCWGDIIANASKVKGIRGTVIDGMCRDIDGSREVGYPVYGLNVTMISGRNRLVQVASGTPVQIRGVTVHEDDYVIADNCGTVFIPAGHIENVLLLAEQIDRRERLMIQDVRAGVPVSEVMHDAKFEAIREEIMSVAAAARTSSSKQSKKPSDEDQELVALLSGLDSPAVSDALDKLGIPGQAFGLMPLADYKKVTIGPAFTVRYVPASNPPGSVGDFIDDVTAGDVVVIDNGSRADCTVWGDIMTQYAGLRGIAGTVIDGVCRDVNLAIEDNYPIFSVGRWMRTGKDRVQVGGINEPVGIGKVHVNPRDIVVADANGVVIVPRDRVREVAEVARKIDNSEAGIREMTTSGATIAEARKALGYHTLQRKE
ncbi:ribonuclease E inhibitor RraA/Dimethylmenaquinone methyltransferase [Aspergillus ambiguus]|uniref:RraA family protein n=1 Tax=Aspergillus ambiguus TaxID=176160 RepID=UPI003CCCB15B